MKYVRVSAFVLYIILVCSLSTLLLSENAQDGILYFKNSNAVVNKANNIESFKKGDLIFFEKIKDEQELKEGDILLFVNRTQETKTDYSISKFKTNNTVFINGVEIESIQVEDDLENYDAIYQVQLRGIYKNKVSFLGHITSFLLNKIVFLTIVIVPLIGFSIFYIKEYIELSVKEKIKGSEKNVNENKN